MYNLNIKDNINKMASNKLIKHKALTDIDIIKEAKELQKSHLILGDWMINGISNADENTSEPEELIHLLIRQRNFGVLGKLIEGEMLSDDFETIKDYCLLEELYSTKLHSTFFHHENAIIETIMLAAKARLEIVMSEGADFKKIYDLENDNFDISGEIELNELAAIADMSLQSVRNHISQGKAGFNIEQRQGKFYVSVDEAKLWLKQRNSFKPTINFMEVDFRELKDGVLLVPVAKDGSYFNSDCRMAKGYQVGDKGNETHFNNFNSARDHLMMMPLARWRRPNASNNFGIVSASEWKFIPKDKVLTK